MFNLFNPFKRLKESLYFQYLKEIKALKQANARLTEDTRILKRCITHRNILIKDLKGSLNESIKEKLQKERELTVHKNKLKELNLNPDELKNILEHKGCSIQYDTRNISCVNKDYEILYTCTVNPAERKRLQETYKENLKFYLSSPEYWEDAYECNQRWQ